MAKAKRQRAPWFYRYIKTRARQVWGWSPERKKAKERARVENGPGGIHQYKCEQCNAQPLQRDGVEIDHVSECESPLGWEEGGAWNGYFDRLYCPAEELRVLCKPCHLGKTLTVATVRRSNKKAKPPE